MNWKRGLFRIWGTLSALWIVATVYTSIPSLKELKEPVVIQYGSNSLTFPADVTKTELKTALIDFINDQAHKYNPPLPAGFVLDDAPATADYYIKDFKPKRLSETLITVLENVFVPRLSAFIIGIIFFWIGNGFRSNKVST